MRSKLVVLLIAICGIGIGIASVYAQDTVGYLMSSTLDGLVLEGIDTAGELTDVITIPGIVLADLESNEGNWVTDSSLVAVSPDNEHIAISAFRVGGERRLSIYEIPTEDINHYDLTDDFQRGFPLVDWSSDSTLILLDGLGPTGVFDVVSKRLTIISESPIFAREWLPNSRTIAFVQSTDCAAPCVEGSDLYVFDIDRQLLSNVSDVRPNVYGIGDEIPYRYGIPTISYSNSQERFYFVFRDSTPESDPRIVVYSTRFDGNDPRLELDAATYFLNQHDMRWLPGIDHVHLSMGQFDEGFAFVDAAPIIMETGVGRVQAVFSIGGNTEPDLLYSQLTGLDAEYIVTHDLSLSPDRRYMAFRGVHPLSRQHTLQVIDLTTGSEVFSDKGDASFCNLNWVDDKTLFYGVVFNNRGCQPWRSWSQPVNEMYALDVEIDQVTRIASSDNELLNFVPSQ